MSEYIIDGTLLTNIADAVRSVDGSSSTLTPEQMATRLNAVKSSIDAALSALTAKEVEVPSGSTVHGLADLIAAVKTGSEIYTGTFTGTGSGGYFSLGVSLPEFTNYCFIVVTLSSVDIYYGGVRQYLNSALINRCYVGSNTYTSNWIMKFAEGQIFNQNFQSGKGYNYRWVYFELEGTA